MKQKILILLLTVFITHFSVISAVAVEQVYVPATPSSIPLILALEEIEELEPHLYVNHSQANALFLRGEVKLMLTGLSVAQKLSAQGTPLSLLSSHVTGLSYLVSRKDLPQIQSFADLSGKKLWLPFPGSPLEEVCAYFAKQENLILGEDIQVGYTRFDAAIQLLARGKIDYAVIPESFVTLAEKKDGVKVQLSLASLWQEATDETTGYPQVALIAQNSWAQDNKETIEHLFLAFGAAVETTKTFPKKAVEKTKHYFTLPQDVLVQALKRTEFTLLYKEDLRNALKKYYKYIGRDISNEAVY